MSNNVIRRTIHPQIRILDSAQGLVEYVASDETIDHYGEIIRAKGWKFTHFSKNAPFVDSHNYWCIERLLGQVVSFEVKRKRLIEVVKWAIDVTDNKLAQIGWQMTQGSYLKAVSVGFIPTRWVSNGRDPQLFEAELDDIGLDADAKVRRIFQEQEQIELSACIIGANPNALAKAYKAGAIGDDALETLSREIEREQTRQQTAFPAFDAADAGQARRQQQSGREQFLKRFDQVLKGI